MTETKCLDKLYENNSTIYIAEQILNSETYVESYVYSGNLTKSETKMLRYIKAVKSNNFNIQTKLIKLIADEYFKDPTLMIQAYWNKIYNIPESIPLFEYELSINPDKFYQNELSDSLYYYRNIINHQEFKSRTILKIIKILEKKYIETGSISNNYWNELCFEPQAIYLIEMLIKKLIENQNLIENSIENVNLIENPNVNLIENPNVNLIENTINWYNLSSNPAIFTYNYSAIKEHFHPINEEIVKKCYHPKNLSKFEEWGIEFNFKLI